MKIDAGLPLALFVLALAPAAGQADDDQQGRKACMYDALTVCAQYVPGSPADRGLSLVQPSANLGTVPPLDRPRWQRRRRSGAGEVTSGPCPTNRLLEH